MYVGVVQAAQRIEAYAGFGLFDLDLWAIVFAQDLCDGHVVFFSRKTELLTVAFIVCFVVEKPM